MHKKQKVVVILILVCMFLSGCAKENKAANVLWPDLIAENAYTLSDGTAVSIYMHSKDTDDPKYYRLDNGAVILAEINGFGFKDILAYEHRTFSTNDNPFLQLPQEIKEIIWAHYKQMGKQYDIELELENAYLLYKRYTEAGGTYWTGESDEDGVITLQAPTLQQYTTETAYNDKLMFFYTNVSKPLPIDLQPEPEYDFSLPRRDGGFYGFYTVFHTETGEVIPQYELFTIPEDEIAERLFAIPDYLTDEERTMMKEQLKPEYIGLEDNQIVIWFPHETIHGNGYVVSINCADIKDILQPWAIPYHEE